MLSIAPCLHILIGGLPELDHSPVVAADLYVVVAAVVRALLPQDPFGHAKRP